MKFKIGGEVQLKSDHPNADTPSFMGAGVIVKHAQWMDQLNDKAWSIKFKTTTSCFYSSSLELIVTGSGIFEEEL